ncbi:MAG: flavin reductase family protein [Candidatus Omnitrophota bacterium]|nr:MAG: flavin reductase family protein [Candidatus Omnitrophota bacterium]
MKKKAYPLSRIYRLLEPGPVVMVVTSHKGKANVMTMSWHTMMEFTPALIGCVVSNRNYTFKTLKKTKECVIAIPAAKMAKKVVGIGSVSGKNIDKFKKFGLTAKPASVVKAPLIAECFANIECKVVDTALVNKYNFFILKVVKAWIDSTQRKPVSLHHHGKGFFTVNNKKIKVPFKSGEP